MLRPRRVPESAVWCLRIGLALQCLAAAYLAWVHYSPVDTYLLMSAGWSEAAATGVDRAAALVLAGVAGLCLLAGRRLVHVRRVALVLAAAWMALCAAATYVDRGSVHAYLAPWAEAVRYVAPLALLAWWAPGHDDARGRAAGALLRLALAATFAAHGLEALAHDPRFVDLTLAAGQRLLGLRLEQATAEGVLTAIGAIDVALALALLALRSRGVALYMALWGLATALSRVIHSGLGSWHETLLRAENFLAPLAVWLLWRADAEPSPPTDAIDPAAPVDRLRAG